MSQTIEITLFPIAILVCVALVALCVYYQLRIRKQRATLIERELVFQLISTDLDAVYILYRGPQHKVVYVSPNVERILGVTQDAIYEDPFALHACRLNNRNYASRIEDMDELLPGGKLVEECELKNIKTGQPDLFSYELYRPKEGFGDLIMGIILSRADEEARRQEIRDALEVAREASESKSAFLSSMSHDIRTPMNAIIGYLDLLRKNLHDDAKANEYLLKIENSAHHLLSLINDVLDMSKIEAGKTTLNLETINVEEVIEDVSDMMRGQADAKNVTFETNFELAPEVEVQLDRLRLAQILINILSNAVKYTPEGGHIWFNVKRIDAADESVARYQFVVQDNGIGMSQDFVRQIFTSFSREENSTTNKVQGTGLGMAITKNLVDLMGGTIKVKSVKDSGSTFTVILEFGIIVAGKKAVHREKRVGKESPIKGLNILAAEDNSINAELLSDLMEIEGANCEIVENGQKLVDRFLTCEPGEFDIILTDIQMPVLDGYDATRAIRESSHAQAKTMPIVAMSAAVFSDDVAKAYESGMNAHVAKPLDMDNLKATICDLLENA